MRPAFANRLRAGERRARACPPYPGGGGLRGRNGGAAGTAAPPYLCGGCFCAGKQAFLLGKTREMGGRKKSMIVCAPIACVSVVLAVRILVLGRDMYVFRIHEHGVARIPVRGKETRVLFKNLAQFQYMPETTTEGGMVFRNVIIGYWYTFSTGREEDYIHVSLGDTDETIPAALVERIAPYLPRIEERGFGKRLTK